MRTSNIFVTVDAVVFKQYPQQPQVLLIQRKNDPFRGQWALPGGFVDQHEDLDAAAQRELEEETSLQNIVLKQFHAFGKPHRDPRAHTVSVAYVGIADDTAVATAADDATDAQWFSVRDLPEVAFDHRDIISLALKKL